MNYDKHFRHLITNHLIKKMKKKNNSKINVASRRQFSQQLANIIKAPCSFLRRGVAFDLNMLWLINGRTPQTLGVSMALSESFRQVASARPAIVLLTWDWRGGHSLRLLQTTLHMPGIPPDRTTRLEHMPDWWKESGKCVFLMKTTAAPLKSMTVIVIG